MKPFLLYRARSFDAEQPRGPNVGDLASDLELQTLFDAMAAGDKFLFEVVSTVIVSPEDELDTILYRQAVLRDCLTHASLVRQIYAIAVEAIERERKDFWRLSNKYPQLNLSRAVDVLRMFLDKLQKLRAIADEHAPGFESEGFGAFFAMLKRELSDEYLASITNHLQELSFPDGALISANLGPYNKGVNYVLRTANPDDRGWLTRIFGRGMSEYTFRLHPRDESGFTALSELRDRGINSVANALAQSADHVLGFFRLLRSELAFYLGCLNLHEQLTRKGEPVCFPLPASPGERRYTARGLYDVCLSLRQEDRVVGSDVNADARDLVIITGANRGGKSTLLRAIGLAQLMMQCGMFAAAESFSASVCRGLFTHFKREEDRRLRSGKFDEELQRMSRIVDHLRPDSIVLLNESFAATNEREGSEIARQVISALIESGIRVFFVTHLYECARSFYERGMRNALFLRAERQPDGTRTFKILEGEPLQTSHGEDLYRRIFNSQPQSLGDRNSKASPA